MTQQQIAAQTGALGPDGNLNVYTVPGSVIATPNAAAVIFDGTGAAGAFIPCLTFRTQTGAIIARCPASEVAAGDTAEVSWFPSVGSQSAPARSASAIPVAAGRVDPGTPITIAAHGAFDIPWYEVNITDPSQLSWSSGTPRIVNVTNGGIVLYSLTVMPDSDWPLAADGNIRFWGRSGDDTSFETTSLFASYPAVDVFSDQATGPWPVTINGIPAPGSLNGSKTWQARIVNNTASPWTFGAGTHFTVTRLSDFVVD